MITTLKKLWQDDGAQDVAEYALLLAVVLLFTVLSVSSLANEARTTINSAGQAITPK